MAAAAWARSHCQAQICFTAFVAVLLTMHLIHSTEKVSSPCHEVIGHMKSRTRERNVPVASKPHIHSLQELAKARRFKAQDGIDSSEASFCVYLRKQAEHSIAPKLQKLLWRLR